MSKYSVLIVSFLLFFPSCEKDSGKDSPTTIFSGVWNLNEIHMDCSDPEVLDTTLTEVGECVFSVCHTGSVMTSEDFCREDGRIDLILEPELAILFTCCREDPLNTGWEINGDRLTTTISASTNGNRCTVTYWFTR
jgi:hypothetical protein